MKLPPLPDVLANDPRIKGDMVRHIRDYAAAAIEANRASVIEDYKAGLKPVAWANQHNYVTTVEPAITGGKLKWDALYRLDDQP
jgi:hypothetical protein